MSIHPEDFFNQIQKRVSSGFLLTIGDFVRSTILDEISKVLLTNIKSKFPVLETEEQFILKLETGVFIFIKVNQEVGFGVFHPEQQSFGLALMTVEKTVDFIKKQLKLGPITKNAKRLPKTRPPEPAEKTELTKSAPQVNSQIPPSRAEKVTPEPSSTVAVQDAPQANSITSTSPHTTSDSMLLPASERFPLLTLLQVINKPLFNTVFHGMLLGYPIIIVENYPTLTPHIYTFFSEVLPEAMISNVDKITQMDRKTLSKKMSEHKNSLIINAVSNKILYSPFQKKKLIYEPWILEKALKMGVDAAQKLVLTRELERLLIIVLAAIELPQTQIFEDEFIKIIKESKDITIDAKIIPLIKNVAKAHYDVNIDDKIVTKKDKISGFLKDF